ncbi:MAG: serine hydrolase domain-containing protein [Acidimicrobiales bacterium]
MSKVRGTTDPRFEPVREQLERNLDVGDDLGASVTVFHQGEAVVDIWGGYQDTNQRVAWQRDTLVNVWSTTKTMTFLVALILADRGELDFHKPVSTYWPEFAASGKSTIEVRHVMGHTAGLSGFAEPIEPEDLADWERCVGILARQEPWWSPGTVSGYHAVTQGYLIGEIVRRITGTTIGTFFDAEVATVLGADFYIGLPESAENRVNVVIPPPALELNDLDHDSMTYRTFNLPRLDATMPQHRWWRAAEIPAANGHGNAHSVALVQQIITNRGEANGHRFYSERTGEAIFETQANGMDLVLGTETHFGMGYGLASSTIPIGPRACYWGGYGGSLVVMDQDSGLTVAYVMNLMRSGLVNDVRGATMALVAALASIS